MVKKQKTTQRKSRTQKSTGASDPVAESLSLSLSKSGFSFGRALKTVILAAAAIFVVSFLWKHYHNAGSSSQAAKAENPAWGPKIKMEAVDKFNVSGNIQALKADAQGTLYVLTNGRIDSYKSDKANNGQVTGGIDLTISSEWMNMAFDGNRFYVTGAGPTICIVNKDLSKIEKTIHVKGVKALFGIAVSPQGRIYVSDQTLHTVYILDGNGKILGKVGGPESDEGGLNCPVDVAFDSAGGIYTHDHLASAIDHFSPTGKLVAAWPVPWSAHNYERLCILQGKIYIDGFNDQRLFIQDLSGKNIGQCVELADGSAMDKPQMVGAGLDGYLYVNENNVVYKLKPWDLPTTAPSEDVAVAVSSSAAK